MSSSIHDSNAITLPLPLPEGMEIELGFTHALPVDFETLLKHYNNPDDLNDLDVNDNVMNTVNDNVLNTVDGTWLLYLLIWEIIDDRVLIDQNDLKGVEHRLVKLSNLFESRIVHDVFNRAAPPIIHAMWPEFSEAICRLNNLLNPHSAFFLERFSDLGSVIESETQLQLLTLCFPDTYLNSEDMQLLANYIMGNHGRQIPCKLASLLGIGIDGEKESKILGNALMSARCSPTLTSLQLLLGVHVSRDAIEYLLECISSRNNKISHLGLKHVRPPSWNDAYDILCTMLESGKLEKLRTIRLWFDDADYEDYEDYEAAGDDAGEDYEAAANRFAQALSSQHSNIEILELSGRHSLLREAAFWSKLQDSKVKKLKCVRISSNRYSEGIGGLIQFLTWDECPLLCLQLFTQPNPFYPELERELLDALERNITLVHLYYNWQLPNMEGHVRASSYLKRNRMYRAAKFSFTPRKIVRLFLCGDGEAGKTTIRRQLLRLQPNTITAKTTKVLGWFNTNLPLSNAMCEDRTRGMELHALSMGEHGNKLLICDLGGQEEYHSFHHFFVSGSSNRDIFLIVFKYDQNSQHSYADMRPQLEYWLKFLVSHRSNTRYETRPKVLVVFNFFNISSSSPSVDHVTKTLMNTLDKYQDVLDIKLPDHQPNQSDIPNVFRIVALNILEVKPIYNRLEMLYNEVLENSPKIPSQTNNILSAINSRARSWACPCLLKSQEAPPILTLQELLMRLHGNTNLAKEYELLLHVLHNHGQLIFFPSPSTMAEPSEQLLITNPSWFYNKVIGKVLEPESLRGSSTNGIWTKESIKDMLAKQGCHSNPEDIFNYLKAMEICFKMSSQPQDEDHQDEEHHQFMFPALLDYDPINWPEDTSNMQFFGRRMKCKDISKHLIPLGVFARLQVKLYKYLTEKLDTPANKSYTCRYCWSSFGYQGASVFVRFGGDQQSKLEDSKRVTYNQWVDFMVFLDPNSSKSDFKVIESMKKILVEICQGEFCSIATVELEEQILKDNSINTNTVSLNDVEGCVKKHGLEYTYTWENAHSTPITQLLLNSELESHVKKQLEAIREIQEEYMELDSDDGSRYSKSSSIEDLLQHNKDIQLNDRDNLFIDLFKMIYEQNDKNTEKIMGILHEIRDDVKTILKKVQQMEQAILMSLQDMKNDILGTTNMPKYPYFREDSSQGKLMRKLVKVKTKRLHFMCEHNVTHFVTGQHGILVEVDAPESLQKLLPVVFSTIKLICCGARLAVNVYLPGVSQFLPNKETLEGLGFDMKKLQRKILPEWTNDMVDGICTVNDLKAKMTQPITEEQLMQIYAEILKDKNVNMNEHFGLFHVKDKNTGPRWVCRDHLGSFQKTGLQNPFKKT